MGNKSNVILKLNSDQKTFKEDNSSAYVDFISAMDAVTAGNFHTSTIQKNHPLVNRHSENGAILRRQNRS